MRTNRKFSKSHTMTQKQRVMERGSPKGEQKEVNLDGNSSSLIDCTDALTVEVHKLEFISESAASYEELAGFGFLMDGIVTEFKRIEMCLMNLIKKF